MKHLVNWDKLPIFLAILLYLLIYLLRWQQGGWEIQLDLFSQLRKSLDSQISSFLPSPQAQLLSGILLGEQKSIPVQLRLALRDTATLHIIVVSGQNLSMVAGFFLALAGLIKRKVAIMAAFLAIILYTVLTGAQIPVLRAAMMVSLTFLAQIFGRQRDGFWVLVVTGGLMLWINPFWIKDLSFQLSFLATMGVVVVAPILLKYLKSWPLIGQDLAVTLGAQVMVIPIVAQNFHQISVVGILTNLLVVWTVPLMMILGAIMLVASFIWSGLATLLGLAVSVLLTYFIYIVQFFASLPFAWEYVGEQVWIVWLGYYLILTAVVLSLNYGQTKSSTRS